MPQTDFISILTIFLIIAYYIWLYKFAKKDSKKYLTKSEWLNLGKYKGKIVLGLLILTWFIGEFSSLNNSLSPIISLAIYVIIIIVAENVIQKSNK